MPAMWSNPGDDKSATPCERGSIGENGADIVCGTNWVETAPGRNRGAPSRLALMEKNPFLLSGRNNTAQPCSVLDSLAALAREKSAWPFAEQNGPQMAHSLLGSIAVFSISH
jgi:hypothetical protein